LAWAVKYAGAVLNRCEVGHDGRTAYERLKGKKVRMPGLEFAEGVLWKLDNRTGALGKLSCSWRFGIYIGARAKSGELVVADATGILRARSVMRRPLGERWKPSNLEIFKHFPWTRREDGKEEGTAVTEPIRVKMSDTEIARETEFK
jgi:hypothetical protein